MLDEIYSRLFLEVIPDTVNSNSSVIRNLINEQTNDKVSGSMYGKMIRTIYERNPDSNIGLQYGKYLWPQTLCDYSRVIVTSCDIGAAFKLIESVHHIHGASYYPFMRVMEGIFSLALTFPFKDCVSADQRRFCIEAVLSYMANALKATTEKDFKPLKVSFDFPEPSYVKEYQSIFGDNIIFNAPINMIEFDVSYLETPLLTSNPTLSKMYLKKSADDWKIKSRGGSDFEAVAVTCMLKNHPESFQCSELAKLMNLSVRGLQKKFTKHGVTFSQLTNRVRRELVKIYLFQEQQGIEKTADKLGFQSRSGFTRFFKTEFNLTPIEYLDINLIAA